MVRGSLRGPGDQRKWFDEAVSLPVGVINGCVHGGCIQPLEWRGIRGDTLTQGLTAQMKPGRGAGDSVELQIWMSEPEICLL